MVPFQLVTLFFLNAMFATAILAFRSRVGKIVGVLAVAFGLTNLDFNHLPYHAPGYAAVALPAAAVTLFLIAFIGEAVHRRGLTR